MPSFVVRVWVPDRPGALGAVASRIGAVSGDLIGIEILERGAGRAIDELVVDLPDADLVPLLIREVGEVDGVDVEDVRSASSAIADPRLDALESAGALIERTQVVELFDVLARRSALDLQADWGVVADVSRSEPTVVVGDPPPMEWLQAFVAGSRAAVAAEGGPEDVAWVEMRNGDEESVLILGRKGRPFRSRERRQLSALAAIAAHRWQELAARAAPAYVRSPAGGRG